MKSVEEKEFAELLDLEKLYLDLSIQCEEISKFHNLTDIAWKMGNIGIRNLRFLLKGFAYNANFETLIKFLWACGYEVELTIRKKND